jgi:hypothetical protein
MNGSQDCCRLPSSHGGNRETNDGQAASIVVLAANLQTERLL